MPMRPEYYVKALTRGTKVRGYAVCRDIRREGSTAVVTRQVQGFYDMTEVRGTPIALHLANKTRDDLNAGIE
jgi:hypothetical protein